VFSSDFSRSGAWCGDQGFAWWGVMHRSFGCRARPEERRLIGPSASIMLNSDMGVETDGRSPARSTGLVLAQHEYWLDPAATSGLPPVVVMAIQMSRRPFPPEDGLVTPITALGAQYRVEGLCINCDHAARLDRGALIATGRGSVPLIKLKLRCVQCGSDRLSLVVSGVSASERFDEDQGNEEPTAGREV
jgi:hypothetical protein